MTKKKIKKYVDVQRPEVVARYNEGIREVDKCDHLISLYRIFIRSKKWTLRLITHGIDIAAVNSWIEYKKEAKSFGLHEKKS
ncbi:piggyBac transposable element-derived protein 3-like [Aphis craccivora]|uniref:PiggyBac transposable element-derived protein 3-like n=1 Tax=Aphis craccivora TaxID=307492 RepID=A0A6G0Y6D6_APHCR|nr:piggyBac transposable element-derived protein 3-like [Aphis craccivora]